MNPACITFDERIKEFHWKNASFICDAHKYVAQVPGIYIVVYSESTKFLINSGIQYSFGVNPDGILYIGESSSLNDRLGRLSWIIDKNANNHRHHDMISTYYDFQYHLKFDTTRMYVMYIETELHKIVESELLKLFKVQYGNHPIFNLKG